MLFGGFGGFGMYDDIFEKLMKIFKFKKPLNTLLINFYWANFTAAPVKVAHCWKTIRFIIKVKCFIIHSDLFDRIILHLVSDEDVFHFPLQWAVFSFSVITITWILLLIFFLSILLTRRSLSLKNWIKFTILSTPWPLLLLLLSWHNRTCFSRELVYWFYSFFYFPILFFLRYLNLPVRPSSCLPQNVCDLCRMCAGMFHFMKVRRCSQLLVLPNCFNSSRRQWCCNNSKNFTSCFWAVLVWSSSLP